MKTTFGEFAAYKASGRIVESKAVDRATSFVKKENAVQSSIRLGKKIISRMQPDYPVLLLLNHILGGYFGSRLMKNIREEKGYTYGISSGWLSMKYDGLFVIQTDVGNEYINPTLSEI